MKKIYLIRHSYAQDGMSFESDFERELSEKGIHKLEEINKQLNKIETKKTLFYSSPSTRTKQTSEIIFTILNNTKMISN